ncbi:tRNA cyclic N6-threonylcarbamoyladenosine(37) synthase TcdA [Salinispirillum marinum]|uniref:tRNA cyclic N6-threonylcarbamoyladenosine(37) synthase TcdA n=2 Tax=Saccharospirillaceae TaxID=255527 RepID=A0ABV8BH45_9GAMM
MPFDTEQINPAPGYWPIHKVTPGVQKRYADKMLGYEDRFDGVARLYGQAALAAFRQAHVAVIGVGGVGSWTVEALARSGVGTLTLFDLDDVCVSNTNRQAHTLSSTLGQFKVDVLADRCRDINPDIVVHAKQCFISADNVADQGLADMTFVVDAIDSVRVKVELIQYCRRQRIPFVMTGGAGGQLDPTRIRQADLAKAVQDPLAARVRSELRKRYGYAKGGKSMSVPCVYSDEPLVYPQPDGSVCATKHLGGGTRMNCAGGFGAAMTVTATFGMVAASAALNRIARAAIIAGKAGAESTV